MNEKQSRAEIAGENLGKGIVEMANLMYNNRTAANFYRGLFAGLRENYEEQKEEKG